jgi:hypothetical protein
MKILKKILLSLLIAVSMGAVSTSVYAADPGRISYTPSEAIDLTVKKVRIALDAATSGSEGEKLSVLIKDALDASKEVNANDKVDRARSRANDKLKAAKSHAKEEAIQEAEQELRDAIKMFEDLKSLI